MSQLVKTRLRQEKLGSIWIWRYDEGPPSVSLGCGVRGNLVAMAAAGTKKLPDKSARVLLLGGRLAVLRGLAGACVQVAGAGWRWLPTA